MPGRPARGSLLAANAPPLRQFMVGAAPPGEPAASGDTSPREGELGGAIVTRLREAVAASAAVAAGAVAARPVVAREEGSCGVRARARNRGRWSW